MKKEFGYVTDREGNAVAGAEVYIRKQSDNTLLTLYSDDGVTTTANPLTTDNDGEWSAFFADNVVKIQVYVEGVQQQEVNNHQHFDIDSLGTMSAQNASSVNITGGAIAGITDLAVADGGTGASTAAGARTNLGITSAATLDVASTAQVRANTADKLLATDETWAAADEVALTPGTNVALDLSTGINFSLAMGGNYTLDNPTNTKPGQSGEIYITQDGTGSRTLAYGSNFKFAGGADPVLSTAAGAVDVLSYKVRNSTYIIAALSKAFG